MCDKYDLNPILLMVGDKLCDIKSGLNGGIRAAFVRSGKASDGGLRISLKSTVSHI